MPAQVEQISLTYVSTVAADVDADELLELLAGVRPKNESLGITGMLLYSGGNVMQVLEGPGQHVNRLFGVIERDPRHHGLMVLVCERVEERSFPDWSMGFRHLEGAAVAADLGPNLFMSGTGVEPNSGAARRLLEVFRQTMR